MYNEASLKSAEQEQWCALYKMSKKSMKSVGNVQRQYIKLPKQTFRAYPVKGGEIMDSLNLSLVKAICTLVVDRKKSVLFSQWGLL